MRIGTTERGDAGRNLVWLKALERGVVAGVVAVTKAPQALVGLNLPPQTVIHCTITGYGGSVLEPGVAPPTETLAAYRQLLARYGGERVVLRIDPIFTCGDWAAKAFDIRRHAHGRVRISFFDFYPHLRRRFFDADVDYQQTQFHAPRNLRRSIWQQLGEPEVCAEPGLPCTGCISQRDLTAMGLANGSLSGQRSQQRPLCHCLAEKLELLPNRSPCGHGCLYCYWKESHER